jgi:hypothetical protein
MISGRRPSTGYSLNPNTRMIASTTSSILFATVLIFSVSRAQNAPRLLDESGSPDCEVLWSRLDAFASDLAKNPASVGRIEIVGDADEPPHVDFYWLSMIRGYGVRRRIDHSRWQVRRLPRDGERRVKFWLVPPGARLSDTEEAEWSFTYADNTRPFIFSNGKSYSVELGVCLDVDEIELLATALDANPKARLNVVLITPTESTYQRRKEKTLRTLMKDYSIAKSRIRFFRKIGRPKSGYPDPDAEYWFVP